MAFELNLPELLRDAESCARLSQWEQEFCDDMRARVPLHGTDLTLSDAQLKILRRIETKVYA